MYCIPHLVGIAVCIVFLSCAHTQLRCVVPHHMWPKSFQSKSKYISSGFSRLIVDLVYCYQAGPRPRELNRKKKLLVFNFAHFLVAVPTLSLEIIPRECNTSGIINTCCPHTSLDLLVFWTDTDDFHLDIRTTFTAKSEEETAELLNRPTGQLTHRRFDWS